MLGSPIKLWVLRELNEKECSGYTLIKKIGELHGKKPSPGYIYPLLNELLKKKFVSVKQKQRKKIYYLTKKGREFLKNLMKKQEQMMESMMKTFKPLTGKKELTMMEKFRKMFSKKKDIMFKDMDVFSEFQQAIFKIYQKNYSKNRQKLRGIIKEATLKLKKLK